MQLSKIIEEMIREPSPIRQIMKMASRQNIINMGLDPDEVISYGGGWVGHHSPEELRKEYQKISSDIELFHNSGAYSPTAGFDEAREALASMERYLFNVNVRMENVIIGQSSTQITHDLFITLADDGDKIMMFDPTYANYPGQIKIALRNAEIVRMKVLDEERWKYKDAEALSEEFKEVYEKEKPKIVLFPSPDNPSSQIFPQEFVETIADICQDNNSFMLLDYAYKTQVFGPVPEYFSWSPADKPFMIGIYSNSKWGRGLGRRLAWIIADEEIINAMERTQQCTILCPDTMHQMALTEYINEGLKDGSLKRYLDETRDAYKKAAEVTVNSIREYLDMPCLTPQGGLYTLMNVNEDGNKFVERVLKNTGVLFIPGAGFGESLRNAVRISYGPHVENTEIIREGFIRVAKYLGRM
ncbi:MAG: pyridoxal phosphate-dependent aminotransferase [Thermoplasmata archaeon]|nr:pyridoxal phosphate-dependent aminotransferase [Thermoplasmata archaeon]